jgi:hypothetical protein
MRRIPTPPDCSNILDEHHLDDFRKRSSHVPVLAACKPAFPRPASCVHVSGEDRGEIDVQRHRLTIVALLSMALLALELVWTRLFSAEFFYAYAFLVLSLAIMGLGMGALTVRLVPVVNDDHTWASSSLRPRLVCMAWPLH